MADKQVTVAVPAERVPEFYAWFAAFLAAQPGSGPPRGRGPAWGRGGGRLHHDAQPWLEDATEEAAWLLGRLAPPARALFDLLIDAPGEHFAGNDIAARLALDKGAHGVAGILAWPGRYCRKLGRAFPIVTEGRPDGGTDFWMEPAVAAVFAAARGR